ncbi:MAG: hypothetical protein B0D92_04885 [Spirochaeta sp. LUC14_002_19_P3]|nr:MAG: hypothetical protein B0D92_04885 [Spirochaeta sp. LUC14_002_19_P3]
MNTAPSTSKPNLPELPRTLIPAEPLPEDSPGDNSLSIAVLNSSRWPYRSALFSELSRIGALEIISIENAPPPPDIPQLQRRFPHLRFIIFQPGTNPGQCLNTAFRELRGKHCLVLPRTMQIDLSHFQFARGSIDNTLCTVPVIYDRENKALPTASGPMPDAEGRFHSLPFIPKKPETPTLLPWLYCGLYHRENHLALGGFDPCIKEIWWQQMEYGLRAWLWGEKIITGQNFTMRLLDEVPLMDTTPGSGYRRFYLKTLAVQHREDGGRLPWMQWLQYWRYSGDSLQNSGREWKKINQWVRENRHRYVMDAAKLTDIWQWE